MLQISLKCFRKAIENALILDHKNKKKIQQNYNFMPKAVFFLKGSYYALLQSLDFVLGVY